MQSIEHQTLAHRMKESLLCEWLIGPIEFHIRFRHRLTQTHHSKEISYLFWNTMKKNPTIREVDACLEKWRCTRQVKTVGLKSWFVKTNKVTITIPKANPTHHLPFCLPDDLKDRSSWRHVVIRSGFHDESCLSLTLADVNGYANDLNYLILERRL